MKMRKMLSILLALCLTLSMLPQQAQAEQTAETSVDNGNISVEGTNGFGNLLAAEMTDYAQDEVLDSSIYGISSVTVIDHTARVEYHAAQTALLVVALYSEDRTIQYASVQTEAPAWEYAVLVRLPENVPDYFQVSAYLIHPEGLYPLCEEYQTPLYTSWMQDLLDSTVEDYASELVWNFDDDNTTNFGVFHESVIRVSAEDGVNQVTAADDQAHVYVIENADSTFTSLSQGDIVWYPYENGKILVVEIDEITVEETTVTISGAPLEMEEIFSHLKIETQADAGDAKVDTTQDTDFLYVPDDTALPRSVDSGTNIDDPYSKHLTFTVGDFSENNSSDDNKEDTDGGEDGSGDANCSDDGMDDAGDTNENTDDSSEDAGNNGDSCETGGDTGNGEDSSGKKPDDGLEVELDISGKLDLGFTVTFYYYIINDYYHMWFQMDSVEHVTLTIKTSLTDTIATIPKISLPLLGNLVTLSMEPAFKASVSASGSLEWVNYPRIRFECWSTKYLPVNASGPWKTAEFLDINLEGEISVGIDWNPGLNFVDAGAASLMEIGFPVYTGVKVTAKMTGTNHEVKISEDKSEEDHLCETCVQMEVFLSIDLSVEVTLFEFAKVDFQIAEMKLFPSEYYFSYTALKEGKEDYFGEGQCPYWGLRVTVVVLDDAGDVLPGISVYCIENGERTELGITDESGSVESVLTVGAYTFGAVIDGDTVDTEVELTERAVITLCALIERIKEDPEYLHEHISADNYTEYGELVASGSCGAQGDIVTWHYFEGENGNTLLIVGCGDMMDYSGPGAVPWADSATLDGNSVVVELGVTRIGDNAFNSYVLEHAEIPVSVTEIGEGAFAGSMMETFEIPPYVLSIGDTAFSRSWNLTSIVIPDSVETIGREVFSDCYDLESAVISDGVTRLENETFRNCENLTYVDLPDDLQSIGNSCFNACFALESIELPDSIRWMGAYAFLGTGLKEVDLPDSLTALSDYTFYRCENLVRVGMPEGLEEIGEYAFWNCTALAEMKFPSTLKRVGSNAFEFCSSLTQIAFPEEFEILGGTAFYDCVNLKYIVFWGDCPNKLAYYYDDPQLEGYGPIYSPFGSIHPEAVVYYPAAGVGWNQDNMDQFSFEDDTLAWIPYESMPPVPESVDVIVENTPVGEDVQLPMDSVSVHADTQVFDTVAKYTAVNAAEGQTLYNAEFTGLIPERTYMVLAVADQNTVDLLANGNLLYMTQHSADNAGRIEVTFFAPYETAVLLAFTAPWKDVADAVITFPEVYANGTAQLVLPTVVYNGTELILGVDYSICGDVRCTEAGEYTCQIRGIHNYTGTVTCTYTVTENSVLIGDVNGDGNVNTVDAMLVLQYAVGMLAAEDLTLAAADANQDGTTNTIDAMLILQYAVGLVTSLPVT